MTKLKRYRKLLVTAIRGDEEEFTTGSIDRAIVLLSIPMVIEMAMESLFAIVDAFFVASINTESVATVGLTESALMLIYSLSVGLSGAATAMVARRVGEGNRDAAASAGAQTIVISVVLSIALAIPGYFFAGDILSLMSSDPAVAEQGTTFTRIMFSCNLPIFLLWMLNGIFRGAGDASTAMKALLIANGINLVLDPIFIFGLGPIPALGVTGAAVATTIGRSIGVCYQLWHLFVVGKIVHIKARHFKLHWETIRKIMEVAAGSAGQYLIASASWIFMITILGQINKSVTAGYTLAIRVIMFTILPVWGLANAAATLMGQNLGAGKPDRAAKSVWRSVQLAVVYMTCITVVYLIGAPYLMRIFTDDIVAIEAGTLALRTVSSGYFLYGAGMVLTQAMNGAGDTRTPTIMNFVFFWLLETPLAWLLAIHLDWGQMGVYISILAAESCMALAAFYFFRRGRWRTTRV